MNPLKELLLEELSARLASEIRQVRGLPKMVEAATCSHLQELIRSHVKKTESHVGRVRNIFKALEEEPRELACEATLGLLQESGRLAEKFKGSPAINAALVSVAQKIEHCEIASYGSLREWATLLGNKEASGLLDELLDEEKDMNHSLVKLARFRCNREALGESGEEEPSCDRYGHASGTWAE